MAVQVDYASWLEIERLLEADTRPARRSVDLNRFRGVLKLDEDPLAYQRRMREEWT